MKRRAPEAFYSSLILKPLNRIALWPHYRNLPRLNWSSGAGSPDQRPASVWSPGCPRLAPSQPSLGPHTTRLKSLLAQPRSHHSQPLSIPLQPCTRSFSPCLTKPNSILPQSYSAHTQHYSIPIQPRLHLNTSSFSPTQTSPRLALTPYQTQEHSLRKHHTGRAGMYGRGGETAMELRGERWLVPWATNTTTAATTTTHDSANEPKTALRIASQRREWTH